MQLSCPEFRLRGLPRIPVRGQTVQGGRVLLRKAPLPSRVYPWSTRRPCGPLAFRCATEGSRSAKEGKGSQEGTGNHMVSCPLLPLSVGTDTPGRRRRPLSTLTSSVNLASSGEPLYRRKVCRLLTVKKKGAHRLRRDEVSRQLKKRLYSGRGLWYADNKCLQDFVGTDDRSAGLHHILSHYVEKRQMNVRSVFAALYTA